MTTALLLTLVIASGQTLSDEPKGEFDDVTQAAEQWGREHANDPKLTAAREARWRREQRIAQLILLAAVAVLCGVAFIAWRKRRALSEIFAPRWIRAFFVVWLVWGVITTASARSTASLGTGTTT